MQMSIEALVEEFARCVELQHEAVLAGDPLTGNKYAKRYIAAFHRLRAAGDDGRNALATLLSDQRAAVRVMAATFLLRHCGETARRVLEAEATKDGLFAFGAEQALRRWEEGTWMLDPR
jgi:hypothetical protein